MPPTTSAEERSSMFNLRLTAYESCVKSIKTEMAAHTKAHTQSATRNKEFGGKLGTIGRKEHVDSLKGAFDKVSKAIEGVAEARLEYLGAGDGGGASLLSRLDGTKAGVIDPTRSLLNDRSAKVKNVDKEVKNYESKRTKAGKAAAAAITKQVKAAAKQGIDGPEETAEHASEGAIAGIDMPESLLDARETLKNTDTIVDESLGKYEEMRIVDMQLFLEDFMRREIMWHAKAIELLSPMISAVREVDAKDAVAQFYKRVEEVEPTEKDKELDEADKKKRASMGGEGRGGVTEENLKEKTKEEEEEEEDGL
ncbi:hypothetical protein TL16_g06692 [Triparma laevis f. inornata]|uniref:Uncharacterized protein n=1 Tax=Triparma laevis f. inornata TaxID=1714386 RepID=A0A9W7AWL0_9STRA|nr:hypothetical protein TL16_g06692 [Triparma laevis f. inornata]